MATFGGWAPHHKHTYRQTHAHTDIPGKVFQSKRQATTLQQAEMERAKTKQARTREKKWAQWVNVGPRPGLVVFTDGHTLGRLQLIFVVGDR